MKFRTEIENYSSDFKINEQDKILTIGSCFSEVIGNQLINNKIDCLSNPFGVVFNPVSIFKLLSHSLSKQPVFSHLFLENEGSWNHYDFHSKFWDESKEKLEEKLLETYRNVELSLKKTNVIIITFGTAYVYQLKSNKQVVANCHKQPAEMFYQELVSIKEIIIRFRQFYDTLKMMNNNVKIVLTVSPVRHTRDTLKMNSVSKSILRTTCHLLEEEYKNVSYFPSYEIMFDDLRDYRFYKEDMIHPTEVAETYIYEKFSETYFSDSLRDFVQNWQRIQSSLQHRPIKKDSPSHQKFLLKLLDQLKAYEHKLDVSAEIASVKTQLLALELPKESVWEI
jgi:GSCFA family